MPHASHTGEPREPQPRRTGTAGEVVLAYIHELRSC